MRCLLTESDQALVERCGRVLLAHDIACNVEYDEGQYCLWVHPEDRMDEARQLIEECRSDPRAHASALPKRSFAKSAQQLQAHEVKERQVRRSAVRYRMGQVTWACILLSILVYILTSGGERDDFVRWLTFSDYRVVNNYYVEEGLFSAVRSGEVWRLISPMFLHFGFIHILFNMLWMMQLGALVEGRYGSRHLVVLILVLAVLSNTGEYLWQHWSYLDEAFAALIPYSRFGGFSGVVYGLLGYVWIRGQYDPDAGYQLDRGIVVFMLIWLVLCYTGAVGNIANAAHTVGLLVGCAAGALLAWWSRARS